VLITANQPFGEWGKIFSDRAVTLVAIAGRPRSNASVANPIDHYGPLTPNQ
jgi:hypothetical protein